MEIRNIEMKQYCAGAVFLLLTILAISHAHAVEEVVVTGTPPTTNSIGLPWGTDVGGMTQHMIWNMQHAQSVQAGRSVYERIQQCRNNADATGKKCQEAYQSLQPMCTALTMYAGARLASKFWEKIMGDALDDKLKTAIALGAGTTGLNMDESAINCTFLTQTAMNYCSAGAEKMKSQCK